RAVRGWDRGRVASPPRRAPAAARPRPVSARTAAPSSGTGPNTGPPRGPTRTAPRKGEGPAGSASRRGLRSVWSLLLAERLALLGAGGDLGGLLPVAGRGLPLGRLPAGPLPRLGLLRRVRREQRAGHRCAAQAELVHPLGHRGALVLERDGVPVLVDAAQRLVALDELTVRQPLDDAGLDAVLEDRAVGALQPDADPVGHAVGDRRDPQDPDPARPRGGVERD